MENNTANTARLGIFVTIGMIILIAGIYFVGERQQLFRSTFRMNAFFKDVAGLQTGSNVRFSGINVGTIERITMITDSSTRVEMLIDNDARLFIKKDAIASVGTEGLMGNKILILIPGTGGAKPVEDNDIVVTAQPMDMDDIVRSLKLIMDNTAAITADLSKITNNIQSGKGTIGKLLMDQKLAQNIDSSVTNLKDGSKEFKLFMDAAKVTFAQNFDSTFLNLKEGSAGFKILMDKAKTSWLLWGL